MADKKSWLAKAADLLKEHKKKTAAVVVIGLAAVGAEVAPETAEKIVDFISTGLDIALSFIADAPVEEIPAE